MFLGENLLAWLVLALGGALAVGNLLAIVRPPAQAEDRRPAAGPGRAQPADGGHRPGGGTVGAGHPGRR